jgi:hypothetical protein
MASTTGDVAAEISAWLSGELLAEDEVAPPLDSGDGALGLLGGWLCVERLVEFASARYVAVRDLLAHRADPVDGSSTKWV